MRFLREDEVPERHGDWTFREARVGKLAAFLVFLALMVAALAIAIEPDLLPRRFRLPRAIALFVAAGMALFVAFTLYTLRAAMGRSNWIVRYDGRDLYVKYRSYLNRHLDDDGPVVVHLPGDEIAWVRRTAERLRVPSSRRSRRDVEERVTHIDIRLAHQDTTELESRLAEERRKEAPRIRRTRTKAHHYPVQLVEPDLLRIEWNSPRSTVRPGVDETLRILAGSFPVREARQLGQPPAEHLDEGAREARIRRLAESGRVLSAVKLARRTYGLNETEAREFVDGLIRD